MVRQLGDRQTPLELAERVMATLTSRGYRWNRVLEPTCGTGAFLVAALEAGEDVEAKGLEIQPAHVLATREDLAARGLCAAVEQADVFTRDLSELSWQNEGRLLVVGNPPWVTSSEIGALGGTNLPLKSNLKRLRGYDALTGESNFDIAEFILLKAIADLSSEQPLVAMLVKTSVARRIVAYLHEGGKPFTAAMFRIDAKKHFDASVDACLFVVDVGPGDPESLGRIEVFSSLETSVPEGTIGFRGTEIIADIKSYEAAAFADGACQFDWRQGVKHDAAGVLELSAGSTGGWENKVGESVSVESEYVFPLMKGTDIFRGRPPTRAVVLPQTRLGEDTAQLRASAPRLYSYLLEHRAAFENRKSSIYAGKPPFSIFGVGPYTFAPYKIAVSGLHKEPRFRLVRPIDGRPVIFDDTCYLLPFDGEEEALFVGCLLASPLAAKLLGSLIFPDSKRPITKRLLKRIDLRAIAQRTDATELVELAARFFTSQKTPDEAERWLERFNSDDPLDTQLSLVI